MKKSAFLLLCLVVVFPAFSQTFRPFTELRVLRTEHFDIVFPERSRKSAEALASFADGCYDRVSSLLDIHLSARVPVVITPETDAIDGYMNPFPYPHIVLFDTAMDIDWTTFQNSFESLFLHELTHAVSLNSRGPVLDFFAGLFGGWVLPAAVNAPYFMVEGVTVSFESMDGFGRANDPLIRERLSQAIRDGKFLTPFQASAVYDKPGGSPYHYGGLFSAYIQKRWGMEAYSRLWKAMGRRLPLSIDFYDHGFFRIFREVYGVDFLEVWADFAASLTVVGLEDNRDNRLVGGELVFDALVSGGGRLFFADYVKAEVSVFDPKTGKTAAAVPMDATISDIEVSPDGRRLLIASYRYDDTLATAVVNEFDAETGARTGRSWKGLYKPRYFRDGLVGIASDLHATNLVFRDAAGTETTLLSGDAETLYSAPSPVDGDRVAFIVARKGLRRVGLYDFRSRRAVLLASSLPDEAERFRYVRDLRASGGKLYFSYAAKERFYKLGVIDESGVVFSEREFSGGVFTPVESDGVLYYRAMYSTWDALQRYPEKPGELSGVRASLTVSDFTPPVPPAASARAKKLEDRPFNGLSYLNPLRFWIPFPLLRTDGQGLRADGGAFVTYLSDPTDTDKLIVTAGFDKAGYMGIATLDWLSSGFGVPFSVSLSDAIEFDSSTGLNDPYRATRGAFTAAFSRGLGNERTKISAGLTGSAVMTASDPKDGSSAYSWRYSAPTYTLGATAGITNLYRPQWRLFGSGASCSLHGYLGLPEATYRAEAVLRAAVEPVLPLRATAYAVYDGGGMSLDGTSKRYNSSSFDGMKEYAAEVPASLSWIAGGSVEANVISLETQGNFTHLYFNRFFSILSWRGAAYGAADSPGFVHSLAAKIGTVVSGIPVAAITVRISPYFWAAWKLSNLNDSSASNDYAFGFSVSITW